MSDYEPKVGDRVSWWKSIGRGAGCTAWGTVSRVTKATAFVKPDHGDERAFRLTNHSLGGLRKETDRERALREWRDAEPMTEHVHVSFSLRERGFERVSIASLRTTDEVRAAIAELDAIAAWLDRRPEGA